MSRVIKSKSNALFIGDTHIPFEKKGYLEWCKKIAKKHDCKTIFHVGDIVDNHAISFHDSDPNGMSAGDETKLAYKRLQAWYKAFPKMHVVEGNHCSLPHRKAFKHGLPKQFVRSFPEAWLSPKGWTYEYDYIFNGVRVFHGTGFSGNYGHINASVRNMQSQIMGHLHATSGLQYTASQNKIIFGMCVGSGIDDKKYAFEYGKIFPKKSILSVGVMINGGTTPLIEVMPTRKKRK